MDPMVLIIIGVVIFVVFAILVMWARFYRKVDQGQALIVNRMREEPDVYFTGAVVLPIIHRSEVMDISLKTITLERRANDGLICRDNIRADIKVSFYVRVNKTGESVLQVAQTIGVRRASDQHTLEDLFLPRFSEALKTVGKRMDFEELYEKRHMFKDEIIEVIGDLNGYVLQDAAIDYLEQTSIEHMDPSNILDAQGIRKITELTSFQNIQTNQFKQTERKAVTKENTEAEAAILELMRQEADARSKQEREIATVKAREAAETVSVQAEEAKRAELAKIKAEEEVKIAEANKERQIEVALKNRERIVAIENERVVKDRDLESISREREVELMRIAKEKELEVQRKEIADVIRMRVVVDRDVAVEQERIKDVQAEAGATREKQVRVIAAEAEAQEKLVKTIKAAEASEEVAKFHAREKLTMADAELTVADKEATAKIRKAEGVQAETAAEGLAKVKVKEADAVATEKLGLAEAKVELEKYKSRAEGEEKQGLAKVKVQDAEATVIEKRGLAEANVLRERRLATAQGIEQEGLAQAKATRETLVAEAEGLRQKGLAEAEGAKEKGMAGAAVQLAEAQAVEKRALAEAEGIKQKLIAEAAGLAEKAAAMKALDGVGREHEEFRLRLDKDKAVELEQIRIQQSIAEAQAKVLAEAFGAANIQIVGGDGQFFDRFIKAVTVGRSIDGMVDHSKTVKAVAKDYLDGTSSLAGDVKEVLTRPAVTTETLKDVSLAALFAKLASGADGTTKKKLDKIVADLKALGFDELKLGE